MTDQQKAALVFNQAVSALIEMEMMKALNAYRADQGLAQAYGEGHFFDLRGSYMLGDEAIAFLKQG